VIKVNPVRNKSLRATVLPMAEISNGVKRYLAIFIIALVMLGITTRAFCYEAEVTDISGTKYFPAVKEALAKAEESIYLVMYIIELSPYKEKSKANLLIDELIKAKMRGVNVEVILDQNVDFVHRRHKSEWEAKIRSIRAYKLLKGAGIKVYYDEPTRYTHAKAIIIDKRIVILGSTNWTEAAFDKSIEASVLIKSRELADDILSYFKTIKIDEGIEKYLEFIGPSTPIAWEFLENPGLAPRMVNKHDERPFDVYLYLLKNFDGNPEGKLMLFYDQVAKYLGIYEGWDRTAYRRQVIKVLRKLEQKYKLIKFEPRYAKEATIILLNYEDPTKVYEYPEELYFELPDDYFDFGWNRILSFRAKFCYFINLACSNISDTKPFWSKSLTTITEQFGGISKDIIFKGMNELRRKKLIEVSYDELTGKPYEKRVPEMYKILMLYDPEELRLKLKEIEEKYGKEEYNEARKYARIVFEENSPEVIEDIILKTKEYGKEKVKKAFDIVARKSIDNPKRKYSYVVGIIEKITE